MSRSDANVIVVRRRILAVGLSTATVVAGSGTSVFVNGLVDDNYTYGEPAAAAASGVSRSAARQSIT
jgi:hypothetical protein